MRDRSDPRPDDTVWRVEAVAFGQGLVGEEPGEAEILRYISAQPILFPDQPSPRDERLLAFCRKHPRAVAYLDAAQGVFGAEDLLRKKILVMAAILETTPRYASAFLSEDLSRTALLLRLARHGLVGVLRVLIGTPLLLVMGRR